jgi:thiol peroxidase
MARITLKGQPINTVGSLPAVGSLSPAFTLTGKDLSEVSLSSYRGRKVVLNIFPSLDTPTCAMSVRRFNAAAAVRPDAVVLCISMDLPFAQARFCGAEGLDRVITLSAFRNAAFGERYGVRMADGPLAGLFSRAVMVLDAEGRVLYTEQVPEIAQEPDYDKALAALG